MSPEVLQIEDNEILYGAINQQHTTKITKCRTLKTAKIQYYRLPWLISIMSKTLYLGNMTTLGHVMHFWCRLFPMSTDGQAWRWRTKRSWCKLQSISPPNDSLQGLQPAVTRAERSGREKSVLGVYAPLHPVHPRPAAYHWWLPTSIIPTLSLTSSLWPGPASGADICRHVPPLCWLGIKQSFSHTLWGHWKTYRSTLTFLLCPFNRLMCH